METKFIALMLGAAMVIPTATVYTQSAFAANSNSGGNAHGQNHVNGVFTPPRLATACSHSHAAVYNPHCSSSPTGGAGMHGTAGAPGPG